MNSNKRYIHTFSKGQKTGDGSPDRHNNPALTEEIVINSLPDKTDNGTLYVMANIKGFTKGRDDAHLGTHFTKYGLVDHYASAVNLWNGKRSGYLWNGKNLTDTVWMIDGIRTEIPEDSGVWLVRGLIVTVSMARGAGYISSVNDDQELFHRLMSSPRFKKWDTDHSPVMGDQGYYCHEV